MNLDELRSVQSRERATDSLQDLRESFYGEAAEYVQGLREERERLAAESSDPFSSPDVARVTDEIEMAEQVVEAIYERRVGKIVKQASLAAAGMAGDDAGLTPEERALYDDLVDRIAENKQAVLDVLAGDADAAPGSDGGTGDGETAGPAAGAGAGSASATAADADGAAGAGPGAGADSGPGTGRSADGDRDAATDQGRETAAPPDGDAGDDTDAAGGADSAADGSDGARESDGTGGSTGSDEDTTPDVDRTTVRITRDVGEILGVDEQVYRLESEDVVALPEANARPLLDREAAEELDAAEPDPS